jgi:hypothetical protein
MYPKTFFATINVTQRSGTCFVLMPFAQGFDEVYETIREAIEGQELNFTCARADELHGGGHIIEDILRKIGQAEIVVVDLTGRNPNVFYKLGIAQMVKNVEQLILLSQDADSIPFDVKAFRCIVYKQSIQGARELKEKLIAGVKAVAQRSFRFQLRSGGDYTFPHKVMGPDHCAYDFTMADCLLAVDGAKFMLRVYRYVVGKPPVSSFAGTYGIKLAEQCQLPGLGWDFQLESITGDTATFLLQQRT